MDAVPCFLIDDASLFQPEKLAYSLVLFCQGLGLRKYLFLHPATGADSDKMSCWCCSELIANNYPDISTEIDGNMWILPTSFARILLEAFKQKVLVLFKNVRHNVVSQLFPHNRFLVRRAVSSRETKSNQWIMFTAVHINAAYFLKVHSLFDFIEQVAWSILVYRKCICSYLAKRPPLFVSWASKAFKNANVMRARYI